MQAYKCDRCGRLYENKKSREEDRHIYFTANDIKNNYGLMIHIDTIFTTENDGTTYYIASGMFNDSDGNINTPFFVATDADADLNANL